MNYKKSHRFMDSILVTQNSPLPWNELNKIQTENRGPIGKRRHNVMQISRGEQKIKLLFILSVARWCDVMSRENCVSFTKALLCNKEFGISFFRNLLVATWRSLSIDNICYIQTDKGKRWKSIEIKEEFVADWNA